MSLFAGCGASDYAAEQAGFEVVAAYDSWPKAVAVYNANLNPVAQVADVRELTRADFPPHDLIIGGPPCQPHSLAGKRLGKADPRDCIPDFMRLVEGSAWLMENVTSRLVNPPWSERLCAADFGDVTKRRRWFYSNYLLHVVPTPGPRRIRDIRDHDEDERILTKRGLTCKAGHHEHHEHLGSLTAHAWHGHDIRGGGKLLAPTDLAIVTHRPRTNSQGCEPYATIAAPDGHFASLTADAPRAYSGATLKIGLRGHSASASASAFEDGEILGSVLSNSWHANEASRLQACRNPSLLEMQRAHSFPETWRWDGVTKSDRGKMIANSIPIGMGTAVMRAMFEALRTEQAA